MDQPGMIANTCECECDPCECDPCECECHIAPCTEGRCILGGSGLSCCGGNAVVESLPLNPETKSIVNTVIDAIDDAEESPLFNALLAKVKSRATSAGISVTTVTTVLKYSMEVVELSEVTGAEQRELALDLVKRVVKDAKMSDDARAACNAIIDSGILVGVVDLVVDATKGKLSINAVKKKARRCLKGLGCITGSN